MRVAYWINHDRKVRSAGLYTDQLHAAEAYFNLVQSIRWLEMLATVVAGLLNRKWQRKCFLLSFSSSLFDHQNPCFRLLAMPATILSSSKACSTLLCMLPSAYRTGTGPALLTQPTSRPGGRAKHNIFKRLQTGEPAGGECLDSHPHNGI